MTKLSKNELIQKISEKIEDKELQVELMEDISDSYSDGESEEVGKELEELKVKYDDLFEKYKSRFMETTEAPKTPEPREVAPDDIKVEEVIDVNEI